MWDIVAVGDVHEGRSFGIRVDARTGISERALDLHDNFKRAAMAAIEHRSSLFIVLGDLFDRTHVSPAFRELVRNDVIEPLAKAGIETWILAGNHDQPQNPERGTSIDDFRGYPNVRVFKEQASETRTIAGKTLGFLILPFLHPTGIINLVERHTGEKIAPEEQLPAGQAVLKGWLAQEAGRLEADHLLLLAHYHVKGAKLRRVTCPEHLEGEFSLSRDMIPGKVELTLLGHIHLHQEVYPNVVYTGSVERADWGEREDPKGFVAVDLEDGAKWRFVELSVRKMVGIDVDVGRNDAPTAKVLAAIPDDLGGTMVRLRVTLPEGGKAKLDVDKLCRRLDEAGAFHYELKFVEGGDAKLEVSSFSLDPFKLLHDYLDANYAGDPHLAGLKRAGADALREAIE